MTVNGYNYRSQQVFMTDAHPNLIAAIEDNKVIVVYERTATLAIYDLTVLAEVNKPVMTVPLHDCGVKQVVHSSVGNYLVTLATNDRNRDHPKVKRKGHRNGISCRVYCNYWIDGQSAKIRPNNQLTDYMVNNKRDESTTSREPLTPEVIDIKHHNIQSYGQHVSCSHRNGNLCVGCGYHLLIYNYQCFEISSNVQKSDFVLLLDINSEWFTTSVSLVDPYLVVMSAKHLTLLRVNYEFDHKFDDNCGEDKEQLTEDNAKSCIEWDFIDNSSTRRLPSLFAIKGEAVDEHRTHCRQVFGPVDQKLCCKFKLTVNHLNILSKVCRADIDVLLCQYFGTDEQLIDAVVLSYDKQNNIQYSDPLKVGNKCLPNVSEITNQIANYNNVLVVITVSGIESYKINSRGLKLHNKLKLDDNCLKSYSISKTDDTINVLTEKGVHTYAMNVCPNDYPNFSRIYPNCRPIFQIDFRTFFNIDFIDETKSYAVLVSEQQNNLRTIYALKKPTIDEICSDLNGLIDENVGKTSHHLTLVCKLNLMFYLNSINSYSINQIDGYNDKDYHKCYINLCNLLVEFDRRNLQQVAIRLILSAKLVFSQLINLSADYQLIKEFIDRNLSQEFCANFDDISDCDLSLMKKFLYDFCDNDYQDFCRFCLWQTFSDNEIKSLVIELLSNTTIIPSMTIQLLQTIALVKQLLDNNDMNLAKDYIKSLEDDSVILCQELCQICQIILVNENNNKLLVDLLEDNQQNMFYKMLLSLIKQKNSVEFVYHLIRHFKPQIVNNFLVQSFNRYQPLFTSDLLFVLINSTIILLTTVPTNESISYSLIESIDITEPIDWLLQLTPKHREIDCNACIKCNTDIYDLYYLLYVSINDQWVKCQVVDTLATIDGQQFEWLSTARLLTLPIVDCIEVLLQDFPHILFHYITNVCLNNTSVLIQAIQLIDKQIDDINEIDCYLCDTLRLILHQLAISLTPEELIPALPQSWTQFATIYVEKCIMNMQSKILKQKIINLGNELKLMYNN